MKPSQRHQQDAELMLAFRDVYGVLIDNAQLVEDAFYSSTLVPRVDDRTWHDLRQRVAAASGPAAAAYLRHGGIYTLRNAAYVMNDVDPVSNWEMSLMDPDQLPPERVMGSVSAAIASAQQNAREASQRERGLTGLVAAFLRWPTNLREAVGPGHPGQLRAARVIGFGGQIFVAAVATALAAGLVAGVVALWALVF